MTRKMQKIIEEIELGKRQNLYDVRFALEEYFTDVDGIPFIEYLLKNKIKPNYFDFEKFKENIQVAYLYVKYDEYLFGFDLKENDLFSIYNRERYIDYFAQKNKLTSEIIKSIKNNVEIIDILINSDKIYSCGSISSELIDKLMTKDEKGIYLIETYFNNRNVIRTLLPLINKPKEIMELLKKYNGADLLKELNENVLMYKMSESQTILEFLISKNIIPNVLRNIPHNINFINFLRQKNLYEYLKEASENVLLTEVEKGKSPLENGKTLLEEILEKEDITEISSYLCSKKTISILYEKNKLNLITNCYDTLLLTPIRKILDVNNISKDISLLEYMLDNGLNPLLKCYGISNDKIIKVLYNKGYYEFLGQKLNSEKLLIQMDDGAILIDKLLQKNCNISFKYGGFDEEEIAKKIYENEKYDLLLKGKLLVLLKNVDNENTYLDCILECIKSKKIKYNLNDISFYDCTVNTIAKFYLTVARHGMIEYLSDLEEKDLLKEYKGKTLLDELLDLDSDLTLKEVVANRVKSKMKIAIILKSRGLDSKGVNVPLEEEHFTKNYLEGVQNTLGVGPLLNEGEVLLKKLFELFTSDGKSDPSLISALVSGYRHALFVNYEASIQELRNLIEVKENNIEKFIYVKEKDKSYFSPHTGSVHCESPVVETILHETGHALHSYLANNSIPEEYSPIIENARTNSEILKRVELYANKYKELKDKLYLVAEEKYNLFFESYFDSNRKDIVEEFLNKLQIEKRDEFKTLGLSDDALDIILSNVFTSEEYIMHQKKIFVNEYADHMMRSEFGAFMAIGDILDAIYEGELRSGVLENEAGNRINRTAGHGISYYYDSKNGFNEMVANFASITKSKDSEAMLDLLRSVVDEEIYNMLSKFYYNNIVLASTKEVKEEAKIL